MNWDDDADDDDDDDDDRLPYGQNTWHKPANK